ncbi:hypothetical protein [Lacticaseibacillus daqingensis]|uniref:hypothetical protein n=1 Tax=Lacticaseibacillus daqingensis TaxID=2486014 RepID=UPI0013DE1619|nr:hypothetical protein [Lacticaseibacillus daqingensis]
MDQLIYVVYYAQAGAPVRLIKAFHAEARANEYLAMLQRAPFPQQEASGYRVEMVHLN